MRHQLTVRTTFDDTDDDVQGRGLALEWLRQRLNMELPPPPLDNIEITLHRIYQDRVPRPVKLWEEKHEQTKDKATA